MDWKLKLFQLLKCFGESEGTWFELEWESFGITPTEAAQIKHEYEAWNIRENKVY